MTGLRCRLDTWLLCQRVSHARHESHLDTIRIGVPARQSGAQFAGRFPEGGVVLFAENEQDRGLRLPPGDLIRSSHEVQSPRHLQGTFRS